MQLRVSRRTGAVVLTAAAVVLGGAVVLAGTAGAAGTDTTAPTLSSYTILPSSVDDTTSAARATAVVRVADTAPAGVTPAGFAEGTLTLANGAGGTQLGPFGFDDTQRVSGSTMDGTYDVPVTVPQGAPAGTYSGTVYLQDLAGNHTTAPAAATLTVTRAADTTAPTLVSLQASPGTVDITQNGGTVHFAARLTDAGSGTKDARLTLTAPDGSTDYVDLTRDTGSSADGVWTADYPVESWTQTGTWTVGATVDDFFGNSATSATGTTFTVTQTADTTKPRFVSLSLDRTSVDATDGDQHVQARITASDDLSGIASGYVAFVDPVTSQQVDGVFTVDPDAPGNRSGTFTADITVPAFTTSGVYALADLQLVDNQGNTLELCTPPTTDGYDTYGNCDGTPPAGTITVTSSDDSTPPALANFSLGPATVTTAYQGTARVDGSVDVADAGSGFASTPRSRSPTAASTQTIDLTPDDLARGTMHSGTARVQHRTSTAPTPARGPPPTSASPTSPATPRT